MHLELVERVPRPAVESSRPPAPSEVLIRLWGEAERTLAPARTSPDPITKSGTAPTPTTVRYAYD